MAAPRMLIDSGADLTIIPRGHGGSLGFDIEPATEIQNASGVKGEVPLMLRRVPMRIGPHEFEANVGWADDDGVPLILARQDVFDRFDVAFKLRDKFTEFRWRDQ